MVWYQGCINHDLLSTMLPKESLEKGLHVPDFPPWGQNGPDRLVSSGDGCFRANVLEPRFLMQSFRSNVFESMFWIVIVFHGDDRYLMNIFGQCRVNNIVVIRKLPVLFSSNKKKKSSDWTKVFLQNVWSIFNFSEHLNLLCSKKNLEINFLYFLKMFMSSNDSNCTNF